MSPVYIYLAITAIALIVEFCTSELLSIWFAGGGVVAMVLSAFGLAWYVHAPAFVASSFILLFALRRFVLKRLDKGQTRTNADAVIGKEYCLLTPVAFNQAGTIKVGDVVWNVITENPNDNIEKGTIVRIKEIKGNKYVVEVV